MDVGLGLLAAAAAVRRLRPDADLVLSSDPEGMPWGSRAPEDIRARALAVAEAAAAHNPDVLVVACNTASIYALSDMRARFEPELPVISTTPPVDRAAAVGGPIAIWTTPAAAGSRNLRELIEKYAPSTSVTEIACPGISDGVEFANEEVLSAAVAAAAQKTPEDVHGVVLGCTHYELVTDRIRAALQRPTLKPPVLYGSAAAVAAQALQRIGEQPNPQAPAEGELTVILSGREGSLSTAALEYDEGRLLARQPSPLKGCR
ncbi:glutamate racemase [Streptomyces sp. NRAIS4]